MTELKCPFCGHELEDAKIHSSELYFECPNCYEKDKTDNYTATHKIWQELIRTRKALDYAIDVIQTVAKMSDKLSREYGETLVEQLDNIQAYCWQEGYVLTHEEDLSKALEQKEE